MAPPDTIWHKESLKLKEIFGTREGFEICPNKFFHRLIKAPPCMEFFGVSQDTAVRDPVCALASCGMHLFTQVHL